ncbi:MAG: spore coat U domain-containing protein [Oxalobacter sp.]|nr:spore coat U domain-containing protein [Oxalobacter sp.]
MNRPKHSLRVSINSQAPLARFSLLHTIFGRWILVIVFLFLPGALHAAACQASTASSSAFYGQVTSITISNSQQKTSVTNAGLICGGSLLTALGTDGYIRALISTTNNSTLVNANGDAIPYQIFVDSGYTFQITPGTPINYFNSSLLNLLGLIGSNNAPLPMYFRTTTGTLNLSKGTYTGTITIQWNWSVCQSINLSLDVTNDCVISAPDINFGSAPLVNAFSSVTQTINAQCTKGTVYTIGLSDGNNALSGQRRLANGSQYLSYEIYQGSSGNTRWGSGSGQTRSSAAADVNPGSGTGTTSQGFVYTAKILPGTTPPAGTYTDTIIINMGF